MNRRDVLRASALVGAAMMSPVQAAEPAESPIAGEEAPIDPQRPIVDPHHHLWDHPTFPSTYSFPKFMLPELLEIVKASGHNITHTVFAECHSMYRADGPEELRPLGETEFVNGIAAMSASGIYGPCRAVAGIIGSADFRLGDRVKGVLEAQIAAGDGRFRGIRVVTAYAESGFFGAPPNPALKGVMMDATVRKSAAQLEPLGLSWDIWCFHTQLGEIADVASALPHTTIVLNHLATPLLVGPFAGKEKEVFAVWKKGMVELARRPNVVVKIGGLGMDFSVPVGSRHQRTSSAVLSKKWQPYVETCVEAFGVSRCMFESNFPPDYTTCTYGALWNTFKLIAAKYSEGEKTALFSGTAKRIYRLT